MRIVCRVEALQLGAIERLERALVLFLVMAWQIAYGRSRRATAC
ncbi:hypothetical protein [Ralstonia edaphi]|nr:hypothetical protein [Ralstonia sp. LMG 6871]